MAAILARRELLGVILGEEPEAHRLLMPFAFRRDPLVFSFHIFVVARYWRAVAGSRCQPRRTRVSLRHVA